MNKKRQSGFIRHVLLLLAGLVGLLLIALLVVSLLRIPLDLSHYKTLAESTVSKALGRAVKIDGGMVVTTSLWPYFEIEGLRIANPGGFASGELAKMELARVGVGLLPLLKRKIRIREFTVSGLTLDLVRSAQGDGNWVLQGPAPDVETTPVPDPNGTETVAIASDALSVDKLSLEDIRVTFRDGDEAPLELHMQEATGAAPVGEPMNLLIQGVLLEEPFTLDIKADSLGDFLTMTKTRLGMQLDIAGARLGFAGLSEALRGGQSVQLQVSLAGADLSTLNSLLRLDLPPLEDYQVRAGMHAVPGRLELTALQARVKDSALRGTMVWDSSGKRPFATVELKADKIQLQDFNTDGWSAEGGDAAAGTAANTPAQQTDAAAAQESAASYDKLLSPAALGRADASLTIDVDEVLSGEDVLGNGELQLTLQQGRIDLDPLRLKLPQASILVRASLKPGEQASQAALRVLVEKFDFGVLTRLTDPQSKVGGTLSVDLDITAAASNTHSIMSGANGYLDIAGHPENFRSGLVDLWAVNLLSEVVSSSAKGEEISEINCMIGRFKLTDGVMTAEQLAADTSKIRICGEGEISFVDNRFNLGIAPTAKRAEFFSLATPLAVRGEFKDFRIGMRAGVLSLGTTAVKFVASPLTTPLKRVFKGKLPEDGADMCALPIGPRAQKQELEEVPGC